jgi:hypothetical protein
METFTYNDLDFAVGSLNNGLVQLMHTSGKITEETPVYLNENAFILKLKTEDKAGFVVVRDNAEITEVEQTFDNITDAMKCAEFIDTEIKKDMSDEK